MIVPGHFCIILEICLLFETELPPTPIALVGPSNRFAVNLLISGVFASPHHVAGRAPS